MGEGTAASESRYTVLEKLGEGGMGVVYKARDSRLNRLVAIKVLPPELVEDAERKRRFAQEARAASALNHPNIVTVYDVAAESGRDCIVMEYVEGRSLDRIIPRQGLPLGEALGYAIQIADALVAAHAKGIVHRDLKPGNVIVTPSGTAKLVDFGLAKLTEIGPGVEDSGGEALQTQAAEEGMIVGTVAYMSPEQAEGSALDARSDIFSFGSLLYHMLTGSPPFRGGSRLGTLGAILHKQPEPPACRRPDVPQELERILARCLRKEPARRYQHIGDVKLALEEVRDELNRGARRRAQGQGRHKAWWRTWVAIAVLAAAILGLLWSRVQRGAAVLTPRTAPVTSLPGHEQQPAVSPDGSQVAFQWISETGENGGLWVQPLNSASRQRLTAGSAEETSPAWSPDGRQVAFLRHELGELGVFVVTALGTGERKLCEFAGQARGLSWWPRGGVLATAYRSSWEAPWSLNLIDVEACRLRQITSPGVEYAGDSDPRFAPDGKSLAFVRQQLATGGAIYRLELDERAAPRGEPELVVAAGQFVSGIAWMPDGEGLIFSAYREGVQALWRVPAGAKAGGVQPVRFGLVSTPAYEPSVALRSPVLVYRRWARDVDIWRSAGPSASAEERRRPPTRFIASTMQEDSPQYSPDGAKIVFVSDRSGAYELWVADREGANAAQLTFFGGPHVGSPRWSPDGGSIVFDSVKEGSRDLYVISADGGVARRLTTAPTHEVRPYYSRDGRWIYFGSTASGRWEIWKMPSGGGPAVQLTRNGGGPEAIESPDGDSIYYQKPGDRSVWKASLRGESEVRAFPGELPAGHWALMKEGVVALRMLDRSAPTLELFSYARRQWELLLELPRTSIPHRGFTTPCVAVSPDGRWILYLRADRNDSDLAAVEHFR